QYAAAPAPTGALVLDVKSWPSNTKLAKLIDAGATIVCKAPPAYRLPERCVRWAASCDGKQLSAPAAAVLVDLGGSEMGLLDQELNKLAVYVGKGTRIDLGDVDKLVGSNREENVWKIFDAIAAGQAGAALTILDNLLGQGNDPMAVLGAF